MCDSTPQSHWVLGQGDDPNALCGKMAPDFAMTDISCDPLAQSLRIPSHPSISAVRLLQPARRASHLPSCTDATGQSQCVATRSVWSGVGLIPTGRALRDFCVQDRRSGAIV